MYIADLNSLRLLAFCSPTTNNCVCKLHQYDSVQHMYGTLRWVNMHPESAECVDERILSARDDSVLPPCPHFSFGTAFLHCSGRHSAAAMPRRAFQHSSFLPHSQRSRATVGVLLRTATYYAYRRFALPRPTVW